MPKAGSSEVSLFFKSPTEPPSAGKNGILFLLRWDIKACLHLKNEFSGTGALPGAMVILAGVDLLGKFLEGNDGTAKGAVGKRFRKFVKEYFDVTATDAELIYQLRNALLHSFGLFSRAGGKHYKFRLTKIGGPLLRRTEGGKYEVDILTLNDKFEEAVRNYRKDLIRNKKLQENFIRMLGNYGLMEIGKMS